MAFDGTANLDLDNLPVQHFMTYKYEIIEYFMLPKADEWLNRIIQRIDSTDEVTSLAELALLGKFELCKVYYEVFKPYTDKHFIIAALNVFPHQIRERALLENLPSCNIDLYSQLFSTKYDDRQFEKILHICKFYDVLDRFKQYPRYKEFCEVVTAQLANFPGVPHYLNCVFMRELPYINFFKNVEENWWYDFRVCLAESDVNRALLTFFDPDFIPFMKSRRMKHQSEEIAKRKAIAAKLVKPITVLPAIPDKERYQVDFVDHLPDQAKRASGALQTLKSYQNELVCAVDANDHNQILWTPLNSGKLSMTAHIAVNNMQVQVKKQAITRVLMILPHFKGVRETANYIRGLCSDLMNVVGVSDIDRNFSNVNSILAHDFVIMSGQMFLDLISVNDPNFRLYFKDFSLIFIDECELCLEGHPYYSIMKLCRALTEDQPKIVGLTKNLGKHSENNESKSMDSLAELCINMMAESISVVEQNQEDLYKDVPRGFQEIVFCLTSSTYLHQMILRESYVIEKVITETLSIFDQDNEIVSQRFPGIDEGAYEVFCNNILASIQSKPEGSIKRGISIAVDYLKILAATLITDNVVPTEYSYDNCVYKLNKWIEKIEDKSQHICKKVLDSCERVFLLQDQPELKAAANEKKYSLVRLEHTIRAVLSKNNKARILIRVDNGALALNLFRWFTASDFLRHYDSSHAYIVGTNRNGLADGPQENYRYDKLQRFFEGNVNVLITTDVCQDDVDVSRLDCFISYNCTVTYQKCIGNFKLSGGYPNIMALIVSEGYLSLEDQKLFECDRMTTCVVNKLREMGRRKFFEFVDKYKKDSSIVLKNITLANREVATRQEGKNYRICCCHCMVELCTSRDIGAFDNITNIVSSADIWSKVVYAPDKHYKYTRTYMKVGLVCCKACTPEVTEEHDENSALGIIIKLRQGFVIKFTAKNISFEEETTGETFCRKGWCAVENNLFVPTEITMSAFTNYCDDSLRYDPEMHLTFMKKMSNFMKICRSSMFHKEK
uniref:RLR CTR domain-containing protein n=1 Tax=Rhabditophanes sp. KR3021 TaxID=114890 RepID=A0AC35UD50_9BILA